VDYRSGAWDREPGRRIDHIYLTDDLIACATGCCIDKWSAATTHPATIAPVVCESAVAGRRNIDDD